MSTHGKTQDKPDALHFGVVEDGGVLTHTAARTVLAALGADPAAITPTATVLDLAPVSGLPAYYDGSFNVWGEQRRSYEPLAVVVDLDGPCWPLLLTEIRYALLRSLPAEVRLLDYVVVTDRDDHSTRQATVGLHDPHVPGRPSDGVLSARETTRRPRCLLTRRQAVSRPDHHPRP